MKIRDGMMINVNAFVDVDGDHKFLKNVSAKKVSTGWIVYYGCGSSYHSLLHDMQIIFNGDIVYDNTGEL